MDREIKFRAWDKKLEKLHYLAKEEELFGRIFEEFSSLNIGYFFSRFYGSPDWVLMRFTTQKDIAGKEIYEDDILLLRGSYAPIRYKVHWNEDQWDVEDVHGNGYDRGYYENGSIDWNKLEVIGNMYESPEMLKEQ